MMKCPEAHRVELPVPFDPTFDHIGPVTGVAYKEIGDAIAFPVDFIFATETCVNPAPSVSHLKVVTAEIATKASPGMITTPFLFKI